MEHGPTSFPVVLTNLGHVRCVVVGGGQVAERKVQDLLAGGGHPDVISPQLTPALAAWRDSGRLQHLARGYASGDLAGALLAFAATNDAVVNQAVAAEGTRLGVLVNVADDPAGGDFHTVASVRRGDLLLTVSTGGGSPRLAAHIRAELEAHYGEEYGALTSLLRRMRIGPARMLAPALRAQFWRQLPLDLLLERLRGDAPETAERYIHSLINELAQGSESSDSAIG